MTKSTAKSDALEEHSDGYHLFFVLSVNAFKNSDFS
jgi:hypothetical protein